jgi:hypothetical protein
VNAREHWERTTRIAIPPIFPVDSLLVGIYPSCMNPLRIIFKICAPSWDS